MRQTEGPEREAKQRWHVLAVDHVGVVLDARMGEAKLEGNESQVGRWPVCQLSDQDKIGLAGRFACEKPFIYNVTTNRYETQSLLGEDLWVSETGLGERVVRARPGWLQAAAQCKGVRPLASRAAMEFGNPRARSWRSARFR